MLKIPLLWPKGPELNIVSKFRALYYVHFFSAAALRPGNNDGLEELRANYSFVTSFNTSDDNFQYFATPKNTTFH